MPMTPAIQPENYKQLIRRSLKLYRQIFSRVFFLALILALIVFTPRLLALLIGEDVFADINFHSPKIIWLVFVDLINIIIFSALIWRTYCVIKNTHERLIDDVFVAVKKAPYIIAATILQTAASIFVGLAAFGFYSILKENHLFFSTDLCGVILTTLGLFFQIGLATYIFFLLYFYTPLILIENEKIFSSLQKSILLVWKNWWRTFWIQMTPWFAYLITLIMMKWIFRINIHIYFMGNASQSTWIGTSLHILVLALFLPWVVSLLLVQLRDLELRRSA